MARGFSQLTLDTRIRIEAGLNGRESFGKIAKEIGSSPTTVSREVRRNPTVQPGNGRLPVNCRFRFEGECPVNAACGGPCMRKSCKGCKKVCGPGCGSYSQKHCDFLDRPPYVCNACQKRYNCNLEKKFYRAKRADELATELRSESRSGFNLTEDQVSRIGRILREGIQDRGQSPHAVIVANGEEKIGVCERTVYNYIEAGLFHPDVTNLSLPRQVTYRPRKSKPPLKVDKKCRIGRSYEDFRAFMAANGYSDSDVPVVEIDTVQGRRGTDDGCLLTLHFVQQKLQLAFYRDANDSASVSAVFRSLQERLGKVLFRKLFPVILTDNGSEFSDPAKIECASDGEILTSVFYCDPRMSQQKGACENNHEMIRRIIPHGAPLRFSQEKIDLMMDNINSYPREILNDKTPYDVFGFIFGKDVLEKLGVHRVDPTKVTLKPSLLKD